STDPSSILPPAETLSLLVFNAPAPTAIYTLSLHDALPILLADGNDVLATSDAAGEAVRRARRGDGPTLLECRTYRTRPHAEGMGDRKSTRLNSSHLVISYAVFCLKKKNQ